MYQVSGEYIGEYSCNLGRDLKITFHLNADQDILYQTWKAPIHWTGIVGSTAVNFIQISDDAFSDDSFDWQGFPIDLERAKSYISEAIDEKLRTM